MKPIYCRTAQVIGIVTGVVRKWRSRYASRLSGGAEPDHALAAAVVLGPMAEPNFAAHARHRLGPCAIPWPRLVLFSQSSYPIGYFTRQAGSCRLPAIPKTAF